MGEVGKNVKAVKKNDEGHMFAKEVLWHVPSDHR